MTTEPNYTDALTDGQCVEICQRLPLGCAGFVSVEAIRYALAPLLTERQAAMHGQGVDVDVRDAYRWRHARKILPVEYIEQSQREFESYGLSSSEEENIAADKAIDAAIAQEKQS